MAEDLGRLSVALRVKDVATSIDFYQRLGFEPTERESWNEGYAVFRYGDFILQLMDFIPQKVLINLMVDDQPAVESTKDRLAKSGIQADPAGAENKGAYWVDPDGNAFYLFAP